MIVEEQKPVEKTQGTDGEMLQSTGRERPDRERYPRVRRKPLGIRDILKLAEGVIPDDEVGYWANGSEPARIAALEEIGWRKKYGKVEMPIDGTAVPGSGAQQGALITRPGRRGFTENDTLVLMTMKKHLYDEYEREEQEELEKIEAEHLKSLQVRMAYGEIKVEFPDGRTAVFNPGGKVTVHNRR